MTHAPQPHDDPGVTTQRLLLRPPRRADIPALHAFLGDPAAMALTSCDPDLAATRRRVLVHEWQRRRLGYAPWVAVRRADGRVIGWGGLYDDPFDPGWGCEVGYSLHPDVWGQGFASEMVAAALDAARRDGRVGRVRAFAHPDNAGSRRVLEKAGFQQVEFLPAMQRILFSVSVEGS